MQELHDKFGSFWIIHAGEMFSWDVPKSWEFPALPGAHGEVGAYGWTKKAIIHDAYSYLR